MDCSPPGSSVHGVLQERILGWVAISFSRGSFWPRDWTYVSCPGRQTLNHCATWEAPAQSRTRLTIRVAASVWKREDRRQISDSHSLCHQNPRKPAHCFWAPERTYGRQRGAKSDHPPNASQSKTQTPLGSQNKELLPTGREGRLMPEKRGKSYRKRRPTRLHLASQDPRDAWRICSSLINAGILMNAWFEIRLLSSFIFKKPNRNSFNIYIYIYICYGPFLKSVYWICYNVASVLCFGFSVERHLGS